ncbi:MAG TPA: DsrE family protein [Cyclobacteriaceae bacterium]|nr:DsrE family protein [Cyclobacteriaceae bacterium]MCB9238932.1 DsrE family protein [Flammeovirgaceae bacterium]MCB0498208.1 DsrE family protein [Cyclobacteriaceae bacterium]MCO5270650.1 DsrE family protein [Cyclobacteriaceae bacterium]MCW5900908.1 DsrE family protein [Cyclobacteriaceae bacterium]
MKIIFAIALSFVLATGFGQKMVNPIIKGYGGVYDLPDADVKIDPSLDYKIVIEVARESEKPSDVNWALNNVARLLNLHAMAGVPKENLHVVLAIHGGAAFTVRNNEEYRKAYGVDNPNLGLYQELQDAGVKMVVCGQSLIVRKIDKDKMVPGVEVASSMLTTMTTYQLKGYAMLVF